MSWITIRELSAQAAEGEPESLDGFINIPPAGEFDVIVRPADTGATGPSSVTFAVWGAVDGELVKLGTHTAAVVSNNVSRTSSRIPWKCSGGVWVTVESFADGTDPVVSGDVIVRPVKF